MADGSVQAGADQIAQIVRGLLAKRNIHVAPDRGADLRRCGLTSLDMVNLMLAVEAQFDIEIPQSEMTPVNFRSIASIEAVVQKLVPA